METNASRGHAQAIDPRTGQPTGPTYEDVTADELDHVLDRSGDALDVLAELSPTVRAAGLRAAADALDARTSEIVALADVETALGASRLSGEVLRTSGQMRMFADLVGSGEHFDAVLTFTSPVTPDLRRVNQPVGVVAVFGAANFPLAFGVGGGDTASALAAGCSVVAKAHPSHPGTSALVTEVISGALREAGWPDGSLQLVHGAAPDVGRALVGHPAVAAVGFTGSTRVGRALFDLAAGRPHPIPVYAEQGSLNPMVLTRSALESAAEDVAGQLAASVTGGWGQFCTKPGIVMVPTDLRDSFVALLQDRLADSPPGHLLSPGIKTAFESSLSTLEALDGASVWRATHSADGLGVPAALVSTDASTLLTHDELSDEVFGPAVVVVAVDDLAQVDAVLDRLGGSLTGTVRGDADDPAVAQVMRSLARRSGRVLGNGVPTGVAVTAAQHHGGPYPASTSAGHTSVGTAAIRRFMRPVAYQEVPDVLLPPPLQDANPWSVPRTVDGTRTTGPLHRVEETP
jgi:NADP-dependent aldehyde dehydrogenase